MSKPKGTSPGRPKGNWAVRAQIWIRRGAVITCMQTGEKTVLPGKKRVVAYRRKKHGLVWWFHLGSVCYWVRAEDLMLIRDESEVPAGKPYSVETGPSDTGERE